MTPDRVATWRRPDRTLFHQGTTIDRRPTENSTGTIADPLPTGRSSDPSATRQEPVTSGYPPDSRQAGGQTTGHRTGQDDPRTEIRSDIEWEAEQLELI